MEQLFEKIDELSKIKDELQKFLDDQPITFIRHKTGYWKGSVNWSTWKILLDESLSKLCVRDRQGFKVLDKRPDFEYQRIIAPKGAKDMLLSKNKADQNVAHTILEQLVNEKQ